MHLWEAALLGVVQGLTEFLPISSTAHLLAARQALGHDNPEDAFTTVIQLGTLVAVLWYFRADILALTPGRRRRLEGPPARQHAGVADGVADRPGHRPGGGRRRAVQGRG